MGISQEIQIPRDKMEKREKSLLVHEILAKKQKNRKTDKCIDTKMHKDEQRQIKSTSVQQNIYKF